MTHTMALWSSPLTGIHTGFSVVLAVAAPYLRATTKTSSDGLMGFGPWVFIRIYCPVGISLGLIGFGSWGFVTIQCASLPCFSNFLWEL